jgi:hypothetical protein
LPQKRVPYCTDNVWLTGQMYKNALIHLNLNTQQIQCMEINWSPPCVHFLTAIRS